jgi:hypothetical protein
LDRPAHTAFGYGQGLSYLCHYLPPSGRAGHFPRSASLMMALSSDRSATNRFNREFSSSSSFNRCAWSIFKPHQNRLDILNNLLKENRTNLQRLLDLYIAGEFDRDLLIDKKNRLENTIQALEREKVELEKLLNKNVITPEEELGLIEFARKVSEGIDDADYDFQARRQIVETLNLIAYLGYKDGQKTIRLKCVIGEAFYILSSCIPEPVVAVKPAGG